jgi:hypothetical protein
MSQTHEYNMVDQTKLIFIKINAYVTFIVDTGGVFINYF